jgi:hypothetical protein
MTGESGLPGDFDDSKRFKKLTKLNREGFRSYYVMHITSFKPECI